MAYVGCTTVLLICAEFRILPIFKGDSRVLPLLVPYTFSIDIALFACTIWKVYCDKNDIKKTMKYVTGTRNKQQKDTDDK